jgi:hypothetical protein
MVVVAAATATAVAGMVVAAAVAGVVVVAATVVGVVVAVAAAVAAAAAGVGVVVAAAAGISIKRNSTIRKRKLEDSTDYVNTFLKMKQEASGWPEWCQSENDKWRYIRDYHEKEGILLDYNNIKNNHRLKALAKLMLNGFWGKFGQRSNMPQIKYISDPTEYFDMLVSDQILVMGIHFVSNEMMEMRYQYKEEFVEESGRTNVVIAAYTTAQARLKLYNYLE